MLGSVLGVCGASGARTHTHVCLGHADVRDNAGIIIAWRSPFPARWQRLWWRDGGCGTYERTRVVTADRVGGCVAEHVFEHY